MSSSQRVSGLPIGLLDFGFRLLIFKTLAGQNQNIKTASKSLENLIKNV
jgi:hypothetical protein